MSTPYIVARRASTLRYEEADRLVRYDPETGNFYWKVNSRSRKIGHLAGFHIRDYLVIRINHVNYPAHRVAWLLHNKHPAPGNMVIDHINGIKDDNRICNLRCVSIWVNAVNRKSQTRLRGVRKFHNRWQAYGSVKGIKVQLGSFASEELAIQARRQFENENYPGIELRR